MSEKKLKRAKKTGETVGVVVPKYYNKDFAVIRIKNLMVILEATEWKAFNSLPKRTQLYSTFTNGWA